MRHIKTFKIFESDDDYSSNNDFMQQVSETLLDLNDDGFETPLDSYSREGNDYTDISRITVEVKDPKGGTFNFSKIENSISHLLSFMKEKDYVLDVVVYDYPGNELRYGLRGDEPKEIIADELLHSGKKKYKDGLTIDDIKEAEITGFISFRFITKKAKASRRKRAI